VVAVGSEVETFAHGGPAPKAILQPIVLPASDEFHRHPPGEGPRPCPIVRSSKGKGCRWKQPHPHTISYHNQQVTFAPVEGGHPCRLLRKCQDQASSTGGFSRGCSPEEFPRAEGDRTLLDNSMILYLSSMMTGNRDNQQLPVVLLGQGSRRIKTDSVLDDLNRPNHKTCGLYLSLMDRAGVHLDRFGDSEERLEESWSGAAVTMDG
jgi:hypothetical protein